MNTAQEKRTALVAQMTDNFNNAKTADDFLAVASQMIDAQSLGRTDRWKGACTLAGRRILSRESISGKVEDFHAQRYVSVGLEAMTKAIK